MEFLSSVLHGDVLLWMLLGISFLSAEPFTGSFHLMFVGLAALVTAAVAGLGLTSTFWQCAGFATLSFLSWILMHQRLKASSVQAFAPNPDHRFPLPIEIGPGEIGEFPYEGAMWSALNTTKQIMFAGSPVRVVAIEGDHLNLTD